MKKFLITVVASLLIMVGGWHAVYYYGLHLQFNSTQPVTTDFRTRGKEILHQTEDGEWEPLFFRGVDVSASMPGKYSTEYAPEEGDYLRWFEKIGEMGANTVRAFTIMDDDFYNAFYEYNTSHKEPLYLLQGILVSDGTNQGRDDAYDDEFLGKLLKDGKSAVDIIHGRKNIPIPKAGSGGGTYRKDISPWTAGYLVGQEWDSGTIAYTDHNRIRPTSYEGQYFITKPEAGAFEAMLAQVIDTIVEYESDKYRTQRLISFVNDPANDPFEYDEFYAAQLSKYNRLDAEHIAPTSKLVSGYFASYRLYDFCSDFQQYFSAEQKAQLGDILTAVNTTGVYNGYLDLLSRYHSIPVVAAGYGFSSARGATSIGMQPLTERQQGEALVAVYHEAVNTKWSGVFMSTWQDIWERRTWNTAFATVLTRNYLWHDLQTDGQNYGLMAFDTGDEKRICVVDGSSEEWSDDDVFFDKGGFTLSGKTDEEGLYLLIKGGEAQLDKPLYLPIDVTDESGSDVCRDPKLSFAEKADFLLCLNGKENSRLLVQERYDAMRENFLNEISGEDPFITPPELNSPKFVPVAMPLRNDAVIDKAADQQASFTAADVQKLRALGVWETGKLTHGNGNPDSPEYNSLADFCYGTDCVEIRIPWLLLNVGDPSSGAVHSDYYPYYGVRTHKIDSMKIGVGSGEEKIMMKDFQLCAWLNPKTHERLKQSYYVVRKAWEGGE